MWNPSDEQGDGEGYHGHLDVFDLVGGDVLCEEGEGVDVARSDSADFAGTKPGLCTFESLCLESGNIGNVCRISARPRQYNRNHRGGLGK